MSSTETSESIHGHDVIHMILAEPDGIAPAELARQVAARFGPEPKFHTCSANGMSLAELLEFLRVRGKVSETAGKLRFDRGQMCDH